MEAARRVLPLAAAHAGRQLLTELAVVSGKGGTGKTSVVASFAALAQGAVLADCDVDAADLHLVLAPEILERREFVSGHDAVIVEERCNSCGECVTVCRFGAIAWPAGDAIPTVDHITCEGCGVCVHLCPVQAIDFLPRSCGEWFISDTRCGPMVHARLGIAAENSGKLVSLVRAEARRVASEQGRGMVLIDGPPGIGCPVIAAITGASAILAVTEPSVSGEHDLDRVLQLTNHFGVPAAVCVNRWDLSVEATERIEEHARNRGATLAGRVRYDPRVTEAQLRGLSVVELGGDAADDIRSLWQRVGEMCWGRGAAFAAAASQG